MHFDSSYREVVALRDGTEVVLRLVQPGDKELFVRGLQGMTAESRYLRFFAHKNRFSGQELRYLTEVDQARHFAMGALRVEPSGEVEGVAVARFVIFEDDPETAEPAVAVVDALHGRGLGRLLFLRLLAAARERGVRRFQCEVLAENKAMRELLREIVPDAIEERAGNVVVVKLPVVEVAPTAPIHGEDARGPIYRLFAMVAERLVQFRRVVFGSMAGREPPSILDAIGHTPLVPLGRVADGARHRVFVKCEHLNPGGSVKDRMALAIIRSAELEGLRPGATLVEATAGNTGVALAMIAAVRGYRLVCVMPEKMSLEKRRLLSAMGAEVVITDNAPPGDPKNFQEVAKRIVRERPGAFATDQFNAPANPAIHEATTGPEIFEQLGGHVGAFVAGAGTGGTITGVGRFLKRRRPEVKIVLADPEGSRLAGLVNHGALGEDGSYRLEGIGGSEVPGVLDLSVVDWAESVSDEAAFAMSRRLVREEGLLVGGSSGAAVVAALRVADRDDVDGPVVALLPDHFDRYASALFDEDGATGTTTLS